MATPSHSPATHRAAAWLAGLAALLGPAVPAVPATATAATAATAATTATTANTAAAQATLPPAAEARLQALQQSPDTAGAWVYDGIVHPLAAPAGPPLFSYQRWVRPTGNGLVATHVTRDRQGHVLIAESATVAPDYTLRSFDAVNRQLGASGRVEASADGRQLHYRLVEGGRVRSASETLDAPAVTGPSLHGHILQHWDALSAGRVLAVRIVVLSRLESLPFEIRRADPTEAAEPGRRAFVITPARWWLRLAVKPLRVEFDGTTRQVRRYEGRVPPMQDVDGRLRPLDARVDYPRHAPIYR